MRKKFRNKDCKDFHNKYLSDYYVTNKGKILKNQKELTPLRKMKKTVLLTVTASALIAGCVSYITTKLLIYKQK